MQPDDAKIIRRGMFLFGGLIFLMVLLIQVSQRPNGNIEFKDVILFGVSIAIVLTIWMWVSYKKMIRACEKRADDLIQRIHAD